MSKFCQTCYEQVMEVSVPCIPCNGKGWAWDQSEQIDCPDCDGSGLEYTWVHACDEQDCGDLQPPKEIPETP